MQPTDNNNKLQRLEPVPGMPASLGGKAVSLVERRATLSAEEQGQLGGPGAERVAAIEKLLKRYLPLSSKEAAVWAERVDVWRAEPVPEAEISNYGYLISEIRKAAANLGDRLRMSDFPRRGDLKDELQLVRGAWARSQTYRIQAREDAIQASKPRCSFQDWAKSDPEGYKEYLEMMKNFGSGGPPKVYKL